MLESESDEEMREMLKEELSSSKKRIEELEHELKVLLLPKDPNDNKNVIVRDPGRSRRGRGCAVCRGRLPDVCEICGIPPLEDGTDQPQ